MKSSRLLISSVFLLMAVAANCLFAEEDDSPDREFLWDARTTLFGMTEPFSNTGLVIDIWDIDPHVGSADSYYATILSVIDKSIKRLNDQVVRRRVLQTRVSPSQRTTLDRLNLEDDRVGAAARTLREHFVHGYAGAKRQNRSIIPVFILERTNRAILGASKTSLGSVRGLDPRARTDIEGELNGLSLSVHPEEYLKRVQAAIQRGAMAAYLDESDSVGEGLKAAERDLAIQFSAMQTRAKHSYELGRQLEPHNRIPLPDPPDKGSITPIASTRPQCDLRPFSLSATPPVASAF